MIFTIQNKKSVKTLEITTSELEWLRAFASKSFQEDVSKFLAEFFKKE